MDIRTEVAGDREAIRALVTAAFAPIEHSSHTEARIVDALRAAGALHLSLVATDGAELVGHAAFSAVRIAGGPAGWFGLGPVAVRPDRQHEGIGTTLVRTGLERLRAEGARGCVVLGEPAYYGRFGFRARPELRLAGVPPAYFQALAFTSEAPSGEVMYHPAFSA